MLETRIVTQVIPGLGETTVTGGETWQTILKKLQEHGQSVVIAQPNPYHMEDTSYEIIKECDIAEFIPLKMHLTIDGRRMEIDSVDYANGRVSLRDMELNGWFPIFRNESIAFIRDCVKKEYEKQQENTTLSEHSKQEIIQPYKEESVEHSLVQTQKEVFLDIQPTEIIEIEGGQIATTESIFNKGLPDRHNYHISVSYTHLTLPTKRT